MFRIEALFEKYFGTRQRRSGNSQSKRSQMAEQLQRLRTENFRIQVDPPAQGEPRTKPDTSWTLR